MKYFTSYNFNKRFVHGDNIGLAQSDEDWIYEQNEAKRENKGIVLQYITGMGDTGKVIRTLEHIQYQLVFFRAFCSRNSANFDSFVLSFKYNKDISVQITLQCNAPKNVLKTCFPSYRNQSIDLISKSIDWFLYNGIKGFITCKTSQSNLKKTRTQYFLSKRNYM